MSYVFASTVIDAPVERVWSLLQDFSEITRWHPGVPQADLEDGLAGNAVPCVRRLAMKDGIYRERLLAMSSLDHSYAYELFESPLPIKGHRSKVALLPITETTQTFVQWEAWFDVINGDAAQLSEGILNGVIRLGFEGLRNTLRS